MTTPKAKTFVRLGWIPVVLAALYAGWVFYSRSGAEAQIEQQAARERVERDRKILDKLGGDELKVLAFYVSPGVVKRGDTALVCYGVSNAVSVRIEPAIPDVHPSLSRCVETQPTETAGYTLIAQNRAGGEVRAEATIRVE